MRHPGSSPLGSLVTAFGLRGNGPRRSLHSSVPQAHAARVVLIIRRFTRRRRCARVVGVVTSGPGGTRPGACAHDTSSGRVGLSGPATAVPASPLSGRGNRRPSQPGCASRSALSPSPWHISFAGPVWISFDPGSPNDGGAVPGCNYRRCRMEDGRRFRGSLTRVTGVALLAWDI